MNNSERGSFSILGAFFIFVSILFLVFILDYGSRNINATFLKDTAEVAALAGVKQLDNTQNGKQRAVNAINKVVAQNGFKETDIKSVEFGNYQNNIFTPNNSATNVNAIRVNMDYKTYSPFSGFIGTNANVSLKTFSTAESKFQANVVSGAQTRLQVDRQDLIDYNQLACGMQVRVPVQDNSCHPTELNFFETNTSFNDQKLKIGKNLENSRFVSNAELINYTKNLNPENPVTVAVYDQVYDGYSYSMKKRVVGFSLFNVTKSGQDFVYTLSCNSPENVNKLQNVDYVATNSNNNFGATKQISLSRSVQ
jgi:hypothetical protein